MIKKICVPITIFIANVVFAGRIMSAIDLPAKIGVGLRSFEPKVEDEPNVKVQFDYFGAPEIGLDEYDDDEYFLEGFTLSLPTDDTVDLLSNSASEENVVIGKDLC